jgi:hypothetical protein
MTPAARGVACVEELSARIVGWSDRRRWTVFWIVVPVVLLAHLFAAGRLIDAANQDLRRSDQGAEIWLARVTAHKNHLWPMHTDGVRHPMWSWLAARVSHPDDNAFFRRGKWLNTAVACTVIIAVGAMAAGTMGGLVCATATALSSLGILLARGAFFQPEPLYYGFSFLAAYACWRILCDGGWRWYGTLGVAAGFAYLSKPSFEPMAAAFVLAWLVRTRICGGWRFREAVWLGLAGVVALAMAAPLLWQKKEMFGSATFSYPKVWMWMDDFESEAWPWQDAHPGRAQLEAVKPGEMPSAAWYFKRHTPGEAAARAFDGTRTVLSRFLFPESRRTPAEFLWKTPQIRKWEQPLAHRGIYLLVLFALPVALLVAGPCGQAPPPPRCGPACAVFAVTAFLLYLFLYGWYHPIGRGDRFMGALWIPCVFLACHLGHAALARSNGCLRHTVFAATHILVLCSLALQTVSLLSLLASGTVPTLRN